MAKAPQPSTVNEILALNLPLRISQVIFRRRLQARGRVVGRVNDLLQDGLYATFKSQGVLHALRQLRRRQAREPRESVIKQHAIGTLIPSFCCRRVTMLRTHVRVRTIVARVLLGMFCRRVHFLYDGISNEVVLSVISLSTSGITTRHRLAQLRIRASAHHLR